MAEEPIIYPPKVDVRRHPSGMIRCTTNLRQPALDRLIEMVERATQEEAGDAEEEFQRIIDNAFHQRIDDHDLEPLLTMLAYADGTAAALQFAQRRTQALLIVARSIMKDRMKDALRDVRFRVVPDQDIGEAIISRGVLVIGTAEPCAYAYRTLLGGANYSPPIEFTPETLPVSRTLEDAVEAVRATQELRSVIAVAIDGAYTPRGTVLPLWALTYPRRPDSLIASHDSA